MVKTQSSQTKLSILLLSLLIISMTAVFFPSVTAILPVVQNPGFESPGMGPTPDHWTFTTTILTGGPDFQGLYPAPGHPSPHGGAFCVGVQTGFAGTIPASFGDWTSDPVTPVTAGSSYNVSAWFYLWFDDPNLLVELRVEWQDSGGAPVGFASKPVVGPAGVWFEDFLIDVAPLGAVQAVIILRVNTFFAFPPLLTMVYYDDVDFYPLGGDTDSGNNTPGNHDDYFDPNADPYNEMLQLNISATTETLQNFNITITASGTGNDATDIALVSVIHDLNGNGQFENGTEPVLDSDTYPADNGTIIFDIIHTIPQGQSHLFLFVYEMRFTADAGETFSFNVTQITTIGSINSPPPLVLPGPPYSSAVKTIVGSLLVETGPNSPSDHTWTPDGITPNVVLQIELYAYAEAFTVNNLTIQLSAANGGSAANVESVLVVHDVDGDGEIHESEDVLATGTGISLQTLSLDPTIGVPKFDNVSLLIALVMATTAPNSSTYFITITDIGAVGQIDGSTHVFTLPIVSSTKTIVYPPGINWFEPPYLYILIAAIVIPILLILVYLVYRRRKKKRE